MGLILLISFIACKDSIEFNGSASDMDDFETRLKYLQNDSHIPGMIAGIARNGQIIWTKPYGMADKENNVPVTNKSIFHLASLTKPFASTIILQLEDEDLLHLDDPIADYGINIPSSDTIRVKHLLSHTSEGNPGSAFRYNGDRFAALEKVILDAAGKRFEFVLSERILVPLHFSSTSPCIMSLAAKNGLDTSQLRLNLTQGYSPDGRTPLAYPLHFSPAAGMISNIEEMLKFSMALDDSILLSTALKEQAFSNFISTGGQALPYGLGWFVQYLEGKRIVWHYGLWTGISSLIIKVPEQGLTFVILANSDMLSSPYSMGNGDVWKSPYAREFLKSFVLSGARL